MMVAPSLPPKMAQIKTALNDDYDEIMKNESRAMS